VISLSLISGTIHRARKLAIKTEDCRQGRAAAGEETEETGVRSQIWLILEVTGI
jgi:hypothetical protein